MGVDAESRIVSWGQMCHLIMSVLMRRLLVDRLVDLVAHAESLLTRLHTHTFNSTLDKINAGSPHLTLGFIINRRPGMGFAKFKLSYLSIVSTCLTDFFHGCFHIMCNCSSGLCESIMSLCWEWESHPQTPQSLHLLVISRWSSDFTWRCSLWFYYTSSQIWAKNAKQSLEWFKQGDKG